MKKIDPNIETINIMMFEVHRDAKYVDKFLRIQSKVFI